MNPFEKNSQIKSKGSTYSSNPRIEKFNENENESLNDNDDLIDGSYSVFDNDNIDSQNNGNTEDSSTNPKAEGSSISKNTKPDEDAEEPLVGSGVGSALKLLQKKGILSKQPDEERKSAQEIAQRQQWLLDVKKLEVLRLKEIENIKKQRRVDNESLAASKKSSKKAKTGPSSSSSGQGDSRNQIMEREMSRLAESERLEREYLRKQEESMKDYKPTFSLKYTDDSGRELNQKEAFKHFAHQFHGIFPGKNKMDKLAKKQNQEKQLEINASGEQTVKIGEAWNDNRKKSNSAYMILSTGNKPNLDEIKLRKK
ncbi:hypothetical protein BB560_000879 [Smittium megazygosporum]|uniref:SART-1 protein n=1 Tax=Smittium megazygosporum TaxID=133381 RepID=A0A2T9ZJ89_9FUNG|nr:hypothetical protein BB560_000879 [Smittium megazygosporum]